MSILHQLATLQRHSRLSCILDTFTIEKISRLITSSCTRLPSRQMDSLPDGSSFRHSTMIGDVVCSSKSIIDQSEGNHVSPGSPAHGSAHKSLKRKAAEALLAARYSPSCPSPSHPSQSSPLTHPSPSSQHRPLSSLRPIANLSPNSDPPPILVEGCGDKASPCTCSSDPSSSSTGGGASPLWCSFPIRIPQVDWRKVNESNPHTYTPMILAQGFERIVMPQGIVVYLVESPVHIKQALDYLKDSMSDQLVAIDLEWRPDGSVTRDGLTLPPNPVAMVQLSSATVCLLIRVSNMGFRLPTEVTKFLCGPDVTLLGFSWANSDEKKMMKTFGFGRSSFKSFIDLQSLGEKLGYISSNSWGSGIGLSRLTKHVLGIDLVKSKSVTRSNWAASSLNTQQLKYAALDVLIAGQVFRGLRLWHSTHLASPSPCATCKVPLGVIMKPLEGFVEVCEACGRKTLGKTAQLQAPASAEEQEPVPIADDSAVAASVPVADQASGLIADQSQALK